MNLGTIGVWTSYRPFGKERAGEAAKLVEQLGYGTWWLGGSPQVEDVRPILEATSALTAATGILNVWSNDPAAAAAADAALREDHPERFVLGIGIGHPEATSDYTRPLAAMRAFFDGLDAAERPVPREERLAAALGPKMLDLAAERSLGTHPYFTTPEHTRFARERVGPGVLVAPELAVVLERDADQAREIARGYAATYLRLGNYTRNLLRFGFIEEDIGGGGSDRLIDAVIPHGSPAAIAEAVALHLEAGADHVCLQPLGHGPAPVEDYRALAAELLSV